MKGSAARPSFFEIIEAPYEGHRLLDLVDRTYRGDVTRALTRGAPVEPAHTKYRLTIYSPGAPMDLSSTAFGVLVASERGAEFLRRWARDDVQLLPATVGPRREKMWVVNVVHRLECIDLKASRTALAQGPNGGHLEAEMYVVDPTRAGTHGIFRLDERYSRLVVSNRLKQALIDERIIGPGLATMEEDPQWLRPGLDDVKSCNGTRSS